MILWKIFCRVKASLLFSKKFTNDFSDPSNPRSNDRRSKIQQWKIQDPTTEDPRSNNGRSEIRQRKIQDPTMDDPRSDDRRSEIQQWKIRDPTMEDPRSKIRDPRSDDRRSKIRRRKIQNPKSCKARILLSELTFYGQSLMQLNVVPEELLKTENLKEIWKNL
jgi:hypothetical protein